MKKAQTDLGKDSTKSPLTKERFSALLDGELSDQELDALLKSEDDFSDWQTYGLIGDVLRSPDLAVSHSTLQQKEDFATSFRNRLKQEPLVIAPASLKKTPHQHLSHWGAWLAASGFVVLVAVGIVYKVYDAPDKSGLQIANEDNGTSSSSLQVPHDANGISVIRVEQQSVPGTDNSLSIHPDIHVVNTPEGAVLRDRQLEPYIRAHQQFSYNPELTAPAHPAQAGVVIENPLVSGQAEAVNYDKN